MFIIIVKEVKKLITNLSFVIRLLQIIKKILKFKKKIY